LRILNFVIQFRFKFFFCPLVVEIAFIGTVFFRFIV
jgi:hypothetical protein